ncbi:MAG: M6 family metalloprotease domain-containing protein [Chthoniobacterales bacterium]
MKMTKTGSAICWRLVFTLLAFQLLGLARVEAIQANETPFEFTQPDGTRIMLRLRGDEFYHWHEDMNGFTALREGDAFVYGKLNSLGELEPTSFIVGKTDPAAQGLTVRQVPPKNQRLRNTNDGQQIYRPWERGGAARPQTSAPGNPDISATGTVKNLVVLCLFSDHTVAANGRVQSDFDTLFNRVGGDPTLAPTGSVKDAYKTMSYGIVDLQSTVVAWVTLPHTMAYYAGSNNGLQATEPNARTMVRDALALVDPLVNFGQFDQDNDGYVDAIDFIHSGYGAEQGGAPANSIWSQKWNLPTDWVSVDNNANGVKVKVNPFHTEPALWGSSGTGILHIGVICHETGHYFGLPDLYDTDNSSDGIGSWCMMANSWGFDGTQLHPPDYSAWCKMILGWVTPTILTNPGTYSVAQAETNKAIYRINRGFTANEFLLIENRQPAGLETDMPQGGIAIWQVDEALTGNTNEGYPGQAGWPSNGNHYKVALLQADGRYDLEKIAHASANQRGDATDVYRSGGVDAIGMNTVPNTDRYKLGTAGPTANRITNISTSGSTMTFDFSFPNSVLYVDTNYSGTSNGTANQPYKRVIDAYNGALDGDTIVIRSATYFDAPMNNLTKKVTFDSRLGSSTIK